MAGIGASLAPISAAQQFKAIAWLRWRLFVNGFRRKGGTGELVARIIVFPFAALFLIGPVAGASIGSYALTAKGSIPFLSGVFWAIFVLQIVVSINISPPGLSFDPESLIRYPLTFSRYLLVRLFLGLLSASTVVGTLALIGAATGITVARPDLGPIAFAAAISLALCNMLFIRMVFAWIDRWLSTRRARELFTVLIFVFSIGIQYVNVTFNGFGKHVSHAERAAKIESLLRFYRHFQPVVHRLPPSLAGDAILRSSQGSPNSAIVLLLGVLVAASIFLAVFAWRMQREYRGENLSEAAMSPQAQAVAATRGMPLSHPASAPTLETANPATPALFSTEVVATFEKEFVYVRRNPAQFYGLIAPLAMVFLFAGRMGAFARTGMIFPAAVAYSVLGIAALSYNILGMDASGVQFYFMAPVRMRNVILGKNLFGFSITAVQVVLVYLLLVFTTGAPPLLVTISTLCWVVFACLVNVTVGNMRSITAPKKIDPSKISRKQASQLSALLCVGLMLAIGAMGVGLMSVARIINMPWLPIPILGFLSLGAFALYMAGLNRMDAMALDHRESLVEELSKVS